MITKTFDEMLNKITNLPFVKENVSAIYCEPKFLKESDKWVDFYYEFNYNAPSKKECLAFEKEVSLLFADDEICCSISHLDFASDKIKEDGCIWTN